MTGPNGELDWRTFQQTDCVKASVTSLTEPVDRVALGHNLAEGLIPH
jgi:hypothetical protein